jgi:outer membrane protein assembly factor BamB
MLSGHAASITREWTLGNLKAPLAPLVVNGVVFALSSGEALVPAAQRAPRSVPAQLFAVDALTGKALWNSGKTITTFVPHESAVWNSMGQVLVGAHDNVLYAFGMNMYRRL